MARNGQTLSKQDMANLAAGAAGLSLLVSLGARGQVNWLLFFVIGTVVLGVFGGALLIVVRLIKAGRLDEGAYWKIALGLLVVIAAGAWAIGEFVRG